MKEFSKPPKWADHFLQWFVDEALLEEIQGDLHEAYYHRLKTEGQSEAKRLFITDVFRFFRPYAFEKYSNAKQFLPMFSNYFKIAIRNILHRKQFTTINLLGLSVGISAVLLIGLYLQNEWSYDKSTPDQERIFRLVNNYRDQVYACMSFAQYNDTDEDGQLKLTNHLASYEEVAVAGHFVPSGSAIGGPEQYYLRVNEKEFVQEKILFTNTGKSFLDLFPQTFLLGNSEAAFTGFYEVLISESMANRYFGIDWQQQDILGQPFTFQEQNYTISGVVKDAPNNVHYYFEVISYQPKIDSWGAYTYVKIQPSTSIAAMLDRLNKEIDQVYPGYWEDELSKGVNALALSEIHFTKGLLYELKPIANKTYLTTFAIIALVILLIIWTNYTNLSIAMYADRQKELGMRKVMGARSHDISLQLLIEAVLLTLLCLPIAWFALRWSLPSINESLGWALDIELLYDFKTFLFLFGILLLTGIFSGLYPALVYGQKSMVNLFSSTLKGRPGNRLFNFRNALITIQFTLLVGLLSITWFIYQQMDYVTNKDLGFEKEGILFFDLQGADKYQQIKAKLAEIPEIKAIGSGMIPGQDMYNQLTYKLKESGETLSDGTYIYADVNTFDVLGIDCPACQTIKEGQEQVFVINQTGAEKLAKSVGKKPAEIVGETIVLEPEWENEQHGFGTPYTIGGIIEDYDYFSLKYPAQTLLLRVVKEPRYTYNMLIKASPNDWRKTVGQIEAAYKSVETEQPFSFKFMDNHLQELYISEQRAGKFMTGLSLVTVILALMGLAGIVSYIAFNRQKEIGVRKVFGASTWDILWIMNKEFMLLMGFAILIATPIAIYLANSWLSSFAYGISVNPFVVFFAGLLALIVVIIIVSLQSRRAVAKNPVDILKY